MHREPSDAGTRKPPHRVARLLAMIVACSTVLAACSTNDGRTMKPPRPDQGESVAPATTVPPTFAVTGAWADGAAIDVRHTCDGLNISPAVSWSSAPAETAAFAVVLQDNDAPDYLHWVAIDIDPGVLALDEGALPEGAVAAENSAGRDGYVGPCPPTGTSHTYTLTVFALSEKLGVAASSPADDVLGAIEEAQIDSAATTFTFAR